jgi:hypothetical protein
MRNLVTTLVMVVIATTMTFAQQVEYRNFESQHVVFESAVDSMSLKRATAKYESRIRKKFKNSNRRLGEDSICSILKNSHGYYVLFYELTKEKGDTIWLKPYKKQPVKYFMLLGGNYKVGSYGNLSGCNIKNRYVCNKFENVDLPNLKYSYSDLAYSSSDLYFFEHFFAKHIFAIKDYVEYNENFDWFWFSVDNRNKLEKICLIDVKL